MSEAALYGAVAMRRAHCDACGGMALVLDGALQCCDTHVAEAGVERIKRVVDVIDVRRSLSQSQKRAIVEQQDGRCYVCERQFGTLVRRGGRPVRLRIEFDHVIPFAFTHSSLFEAFAAACHVCNRFKSDRIFTSLDELRVYTQAKWDEGGFRG